MLDSIYERFLNILSENRKINKDYIKNNLGALIFESESIFGLCKVFFKFLELS